MSPQSWTQLLLSHVIEPGDPRLALALDDYGPMELWERLWRDHDLPAAWRERTGTAQARAEASLARAERGGLRWLSPEHQQWPDRIDDLGRFEGINNVAGRPLGLWVGGQGDLDLLARRTVAIVGARSCTTYGAEIATDIAADCADAGVAVISGAAFGIDACAHRGALAAGHPTIAVVAGGVDVDYPRAHASLLSRIHEDGLIISEYPPGDTVQRHRFLVRNRLIAALASGVVVVEAATRSGSLNTLHWADQLGRTTMAVPGPVTSGASAGTHVAIREGKAVLVTSGVDVLQEVEGIDPTRADPMGCLISTGA